MRQVQALLFGTFFPNIFNPWLVKSMDVGYTDVEPVDIEG